MLLGISVYMVDFQDLGKDQMISESKPAMNLQIYARKSHSKRLVEHLLPLFPA